MSENRFFHQGDRMLAATSEDRNVLERYVSFDEKGPAARGYRLTLLVKSLSARMDEMVRIVHVVESVSQGSPLYVMGPKPVWGEYVNDVLATESPPLGEDPFAPSSYDGRVLDGPGMDTNYEVIEYCFTTPGLHSVQWRLEPNVSNTLWFTVG